MVTAEIVETRWQLHDGRFDFELGIYNSLDGELKVVFVCDLFTEGRII